MKYNYTVHIITRKDPKKPYVFDVTATNMEQGKRIAKAGFHQSYPYVIIKSIKIGNRRKL